MTRARFRICLLIAVGANLLGCGGSSVLADPPIPKSPAAMPASIHVGGSLIRIDLISKPTALSNDQLLAWIETAGRAVGTYYGRFPVKEVTIHLQVNSDGHDIHGRTFDGERIEVGFGPEVTPADLSDDWIMTHEMFHLAFPDLGDDHNWLNEGLSTYLEPISRAAIGTLTPQRIWHDMVMGMPQGQPEPGDKGLDYTHTWGRTYWGGCLFCLLADVRIREKTDGRRSLQDALRAILDKGGDGSAEWPMLRVVDTGDRATGTTVLKDLYEEMALKPKTVDLAALWKSLGVQADGDGTKFDDAAPLAWIRKAITTAKK